MGGDPRLWIETEVARLWIKVSRQVVAGAVRARNRAMEKERECAGDAAAGIVHPKRSGDGHYLKLELSPAPPAVIASGELVENTVRAVLR